MLIDRFASQISLDYSDEFVEKKIKDCSMDEFFQYFSKDCYFDPNKVYMHINWWTKDKLTRFLKKAGFKNVFVNSYLQSVFPPMRDEKFFDTRPRQSLFIDAIK